MYKCFCRSATCLLPPARLFQSRYAGGIFALPRRGVLAAPTPALPHGGRGHIGGLSHFSSLKNLGAYRKPPSCGTGTTCKARERGWGKGSKRLKNGKFTSQAISLPPLPAADFVLQERGILNTPCNQSGRLSSSSINSGEPAACSSSCGVRYFSASL